MAPSLDASISLTLDRPRQVRLDIAALRQAEVTLSDVWQRKVSILRVMLDPEGLGLNDITVLLWCGLRADDPALTIQDVERLVTMENLPGILTAIYAAWNAHTMAATPPEESPNGPLATPSPGIASGALPASTLDLATVSFGN